LDLATPETAEAPRPGWPAFMSLVIWLLGFLFLAALLLLDLIIALIKPFWRG
jgi:hypothetical protein